MDRSKSTTTTTKAPRSEEGLALQVLVLESSELFSGLPSEPGLTLQSFVELRIGPTAQRSPVLEGERHPLWKAAFLFDLPSASAAADAELGVSVCTRGRATDPSWEVRSLPQPFPLRGVLRTPMREVREDLNLLLSALSTRPSQGGALFSPRLVDPDGVGPPVVLHVVLSWVCPKARWWSSGGVSELMRGLLRPSRNRSLPGSGGGVPPPSPWGGLPASSV
eukprot:RCo037287